MWFFLFQQCLNHSGLHYSNNTHTHPRACAQHTHEQTKVRLSYKTKPGEKDSAVHIDSAACSLDDTTREQERSSSACRRSGSGERDTHPLAPQQARALHPGPFQQGVLSERRCQGQLVTCFPSASWSSAPSPLSASMEELAVRGFLFR